MNDPHQAHRGKGPYGAMTRQFPLVPHATDNFDERPTVVFWLTAGTAVLVDEEGTEVTYDLVAGASLLFSFVALRSAGTTATLVGWN